MFEHIHPFYDGNGRMGRFLLNIRLSQVLSAQTALSLSAELYRQKNRYYEAFMVAEDPMNYAELTFFLKAMTQILVAAQTRLLDSLRERSERLDALTGRMEVVKQNNLAQGDEALSDHAVRSLSILGQVMLFGPRIGLRLDELSRILEVSKQTARKAIAELVDKQLIEFLAKRPIVVSLNAQGLAYLELE